MRTFASPGAMTVDWEERVNPDRLRTYRFGRAKAALDGLRPRRGPAVRLQQHPLRHEHPHRRVGARQDDPLRAPDARRQPAHLGLRVGGQAPPPELPVAAPRRTSTPAWSGCAGRSPPTPACSARAAREICEILKAEGVLDMPLGVDIAEPPMVAALEAEGITVRDGQQVMLDAREVKSIDEIMLLNTACSMVDGAYQMIVRAAQAGHPRERARRRGHEVPVRPRLRARRQHQRGLRRALQPAPARVQRPDHPARRPGLLRHHPDLRRLQDLLLPDVRRRHGDRRPARRVQAGARVDRRLDRAHAAGRRHRPGRRASGRRPRSSASRARWSASASSSATASACSSTSARSSAASTRSTTRSSSRRAWSSPSRRTARPRTATRRRGSRRRSSITADGPQVITRFPSHELFVANAVLRAGRLDRRPPSPRPTSRPALGIYRTMVECRVFETRAQELFFEGLVRGTTHLGVGQEAVAAGFAAAMRDDDYTFCTYRGHNHTLARGVPMAPLLRRAVRARHRPPRRQGRLDAPDLRRARRDGLLRDRRRPPADRARRRLVGPVPRHPARSRSASSATGRRTSARSTRRSTWRPSGRRRSCSCARTTSTWSTRRSAP